METLLERADSLSLLEDLLADVRAGRQGRLMFVGGEAGVGKTTLLRSFCADAGERRARVLWGGCEPLLTPRPLGPFADVADAVGGELEEMVAAMARPHEVVAALARELRRRPPSILVLEDIHWADAATLDVITVLAARIGSLPVLVAATYRDDELDAAEQLRFVLGELAGRQRRLRLEPLSPAGVAELARATGADADELYRTTGGNPFFVGEALASGGTNIPATVRDAVLSRAARISAPARRLLEAVAIVPGEVELWLLELIAPDSIDRIDECMAYGMLGAQRSHVAFRHELARLAIEEAISPPRRLELHRAALAALAERDGDPARLAHHADAADDAEGVLRWAPLAGERAASSRAHREAAAQFGRSLRFADALPDEARAELLQRRADECWLAALFDDAITAQQGALDCRRRVGDRLGEGDAMRRLSRLCFFAGQPDEGEVLAREAVALLERLPAGHELAMAYGNVAQRRMVVEDRAGAEAWGGRALELAERLEDIEAVVYALTNVGGAQLESGAKEGRSKVERALDLARHNGLEDHAGRALFILSLAGVRHRDLERAGGYVATGLDYCSERDLETWRLYLLAARARLALDRGRWDDATEYAAQVLAHPRSAPVARGWAMGVLGRVRARRGDPGAAALLDEAHALGDHTAELMRIGFAAAARAEAAWLRGDGAAIDPLTSDALELATSRASAWDRGELYYWRWQAGLRDEFDPGTIAAPYLCSITGDWDRAVELWAEIGAPYEAALARAQSDDPGVVRNAIEELQGLGARPAAAIVARRLRERGVRGVPRGPRPSTRENPAGLTARELDVLALVADGLRNAQVAERLVVSQKTVDHHVSAILRKLDVSTRTEAGAKARRLGIVE